MADPHWQLEVYFDGECPICVKEINLLKWFDGENRVRFIDIAASDFSAPTGKSYETLMGRIHARTPDGSWVTGVEVFEKLYSAVGLDVVSAFIRLPGINYMTQKAYNWFAANRLQLTGRCQDDGCSRHTH